MADGYARQDTKVLVLALVCWSRRPNHDIRPFSLSQAADSRKGDQVLGKINSMNGRGGQGLPHYGRLKARDQEAAPKDS